MENENAVFENQTKLGEYLRLEREKRHISIEQVASATKINIRLLYALESDDYDALPAKPFVRGFVTSYSRYMGLNETVILERYDQFLNAQNDKKTDQPKQTPHIFVGKDSGYDNNKTTLTIVMVGCIIAAGIIYAIVRPSLKHRRSAQQQKPVISNESVITVMPPQTSPSPHSASQESNTSASHSQSAQTENKNLTQTKEAVPSAVQTEKPVEKKPNPSVPTPKPTEKAIVAESKPKPTPTPSATPSPTPTPTPSPTAKATAPIPANQIKHLLIVRSKEDSWVKYQPDTEKIRQFTLKQGQVIYIRARTSIRFFTGNPKGIEISTDNKNFTSYEHGTKIWFIPESAESQYGTEPFVAPAANATPATN